MHIFANAYRSNQVCVALIRYYELNLCGIYMLQLEKERFTRRYNRVAANQSEHALSMPRSKRRASPNSIPEMLNKLLLVEL